MSQYIDDKKVEELEWFIIMDIVIIEKPITRQELKKIAEKRFGDLVKWP